jgi:hypothetical protein
METRTRNTLGSGVNRPRQSQGPGRNRARFKEGVVPHPAWRSILRDRARRPLIGPLFDRSTPGLLGYAADPIARDSDVGRTRLKICAGESNLSALSFSCEPRLIAGIRGRLFGVWQDAHCVCRHCHDSLACDPNKSPQHPQIKDNKIGRHAGVAAPRNDLSVNEGGDNQATHTHSSDDRDQAASAATRLRPRRLAA